MDSLGFSTHLTTLSTSKDKFFNVYLFKRQRESAHVSGGGAEREGERESQAGSALSAQSPMQGLNS